MKSDDFVRIIRFVFVAAVLQVYGCGQKNGEPVQEDEPDYIAELCEKYKVPGLALKYFSSEGKTEYFYGRNVQGKPIDAHTVFEGASLSKTVFTTVVRRSFFSHFDSSETIRELGLKPEVISSFFADSISEGSLELIMDLKPIDLLNHRTSIDLLILDSMPPEMPVFQYSENGFLLAQFVFNQLVVNDFDAFVLPKVNDEFDFVWRSAMSRNYLDGYIYNDTVYRTIRHYTEPKSNGTLLCSISALSDFVQENMTDSLVDFVTRRTIPVSANYPTLFWGNGMGIEICAGDTILWQWGSNYVYNSILLYNMETGESLVMATNSISGRQLFNEVASRYMRKPGFKCFDYVW